MKQIIEIIEIVLTLELGKFLLTSEVIFGITISPAVVPALSGNYDRSL